MKESTLPLNKATFNNKNNPFQERLRELSNDYFKSHHIKPTGDFRLYLKSIILIPAFFGLYTWLVFFTPVWWVALIGLALFGIVKALIGFNVMHDACHGSYSTNKTLNEVMGYTMNMLGSNMYFWKIKHNIVHHTYTNIDGIDDDIMKSPILRFCPTQVWKPHHRIQHITAPILYCISAMYWVFVTDFQKYFEKRISNASLKISVKEHIIFWLTKVYYFSFFVAIPWYVLGFSQFLFGYLFYNCIFGFVLSIVFQLAHVVEKTHFKEANNKKIVIESEWAVHQVDTTADFAAKSKVISWLLGGLNFQTIHHLFPKVSHVHYPALQAIVKQACQEYHVEYNEYPTMGSAVASHLRFLKYLGTNK